MDAHSAIPEDHLGMLPHLSLRRATAAVGVAVCALLAAVGLAPTATAAPAGPAVKVIVQLSAGVSPHAAEQAVARAGGRVTKQLAIVDGFAATMPAATAVRLAATPGIRAVTPDTTMRPQATLTSNGAGTSAPRSVYAQATRGDDLWQEGVTGRGATVALIDTGIADVPDLAGRVLPVTDVTGQTTACENLSGESGCGDSFGHGTFIA